MKEKYEPLEMEVIEFEVEDIITASEDEGIHVPASIGNRM